MTDGCFKVVDDWDRDVDPVGITAPTITAFEQRVLRALSAGDLDGAGALLGNGTARDLFTVVADIDRRHRSTTVFTDEIHATRAHVLRSSRPGDPIRAWTEAILAERLLLDLDPLGADVAAHALAELGDEPVLDLLGLFGRARLRRAVAVGMVLFDQARSHAERRAHRDQAVGDLLRCGFVEEAALTIGLLAALEAIFRQEDLLENLDQLADARRELAKAGPGRAGAESIGSAAAAIADLPVGYLDAASAVLAVQMGDFAGAAETIRRARPVVSAPLADDLLAFVEAVAFAAGCGEEQERWHECDLVLDRVSRAHPRTRQALLLLVAHVAADLGSPAAARYGARYLALPQTVQGRNVDSEVLRARLAVVAGRAPAPHELVALLDRFAATGARRAGRAALGLARDCERHGAAATAPVLRRWSLAHLPEPARLTAVELDLLAPGTGPDVEIRVLGPALEVHRAGEPVSVRPTHVRLLIGLALVHPTPLHVEQAAELLWPGRPLASSRARLNTEVHRLRRQLGPVDGPALITRRYDLLGLSPACAVDLAAYRGALQRSPGERLAALASVRGVLCDAQLPYDEALVEHRHRFVAEWEHHARRLAAEVPGTRDRLRVAAEVLGADLGDDPIGRPTPS